MGVSEAGDPTPLLNELGNEGWEVAGVTPRDGNYQWHVILKRPRS